MRAAHIETLAPAVRTVRLKEAARIDEEELQNIEGAIETWRIVHEADPELRSLPPLESSFGERSLRVAYSLTTPVHRFAERFKMAEQTHPNREGYAVIAETVAFEISKLASFQR